MVEGPVGKFYRKRFTEVGVAIGIFDTIQDRPVPAVIVTDVESGAGCGEEQRDQGCEAQEAVWVAVVHEAGGVQWVTPKVIFFRKRRLT